jgi:TetR/AcrR family transcriptional regulator
MARPTTRASRVTNTRAAVFDAAAQLFSACGFDGVTVDDIAARARVNKAMIYYHFADKLALYRAVVGDMLRAMGTRVTAIASGANGAASPHDRLEAFVAAFVEMADTRPWFPPLMLREIAEGAPRLDAATLTLMRTVFGAFAAIVGEGQARGAFRPVHPVLAYLSIVGPILLNAARERSAGGRGRKKLPMFVALPRAELTAHMQQAALRILARS